MKIRKKLLILIPIILTALFITLLVVSRIPDPLFSTDYSTLVLDEEGKYLRVFLNSEEQWIFPDDGREVPERLKIAVLHFEDKRFEQHHGVDLAAVFRALYQNIKSGETVSGASTITMQLARLMKPKERTIKNKIIEMLQAVRIELKYSKEEILKAYLLHAPYGGNIIGYRTASLRYFAKEPEHLSWAEVATLAVLPNNPAHVNPLQNPARLKEKRDELLASLYEAGKIDRNTYQLAIAEPVADRLYPFPLSAPHLAEKLAREVEGDIIRTTINKGIQDQVTAILKDYIEENRKRGIRNAALLVTETVSGEVKAYVASQDFFDDDNLGKIDGIQMRRSSASTLKPFLYALAMDEGMIIRESRLLDIPISYGGYTPYNANNKFSGVVRADEALIRSLNAPVVNLLYHYGIEKFYDFLEEAGMESLFRTPEEYGLSLILGGAEISLWELSRLYRGLGNYGRFSGLRVLKDSGEATEKQLLSPGSAYLVLETLKELRRPGLEYYWQDFQSSAPIAWKTGTSYGSRDGWAVGVSPDWTIAVWVGNFAGGEIKGMSGLESAAPLLFKVFNQLEKRQEKNWFELPKEGLKAIQVSASTGYRLKDGPAELVTALAPAAAKPLQYSPYERVFYLNQAETMEVCSLCWDREDLKLVQKLVYPPQVYKYLGNREIYALPAHNPACPGVRENNPIEFIYPQEGSLIFLPRGIDGEYQQLNLEVAHAHQESRLFWYLDNHYLGETVNKHQLNLALEPGWHQLQVVDGRGNSKGISFYLERR
ncbi:MAG TPA: penicillin-binding protein 1C [Halanaerobiales bacterium]|jgi:penicillin-binding protein 1C|nr:penicillin-binding protein 1C [Halanaerobiales bacterium]HPZ63203.1 penicillin-binding protein 1C [Halanaerobiales bacterium]HQD04265.1 penicillin-binding protein 1C [Halanaerobiales bacterium]